MHNIKNTNHSMLIPSVFEKTGSGEFGYDLFSRLLKDRVIFLNGAFDDNLANTIVAQLLWLEATDAEADINLYVNSPGGSIPAMLSIFDTMQYIKCPVVTIGYGTVASAASFIVAAGEPGRRYALKNTEFMIHELSSGTEGKYTDIKNAANHISRIHDNMMDYYVEFTGKDRKELVEDMRLDYYMTASEAVKYGSKGLIDAIHSKSLR